MIGVVFMQFGCQDVLDTKPLDKFTGDQVWSNYAMAEGFAYTMYANIIGDMYTPWREECLTKNAQNQVWGGDYVSEKTEQIDRTYNAGWGDYEKIRSCNLAIENVTASKFTDKEKNLLLGEAHFLRAMVNFYLIKRFGSIQIIDKVLTPDDNMFIPRASTKESYDFILQDLTLAADKLPETNNRGRATKGAAYALTLRVALQGGAYLNDNLYYQKVITAGDLLFALPYYALENSYDNLFNKYSTAIASKENILIYDRLEVNTTFQDTPMQYLLCNSDNIGSKLTAEALKNHPLVESFEGWCFFAPTQDLVDDYLVTDADGVEKPWYLTSYSTKGKNVFEKIFDHRDARFYASIVYDSCHYYKNTVFTRADGNISNPSIDGGNAYGTTTGYCMQKACIRTKKYGRAIRLHTVIVFCDWENPI